jgi:hypothetical protein
VTAQTSTSEVTTTQAETTTSTTAAETTTTSTTAVPTTTTTAAVEDDDEVTTTSTTAAVPATTAAEPDDTSTAVTWVVVVLIAAVLGIVLVRVLRERSSDEATTKRWADEEHLAMQRVHSLHRRVVALADVARTSESGARVTLADAVVGDLRRSQGELESLARRAPNEREAIAVRTVEDALDDVAAMLEVLGDATNPPSADMLALTARACDALDAAVRATGAVAG